VFICHIRIVTSWGKMASLVARSRQAPLGLSRAGVPARHRLAILTWWKRSNTFEGCGAARRGI